VGGGYPVYFSAAQITIPEPMTMMLLVLGLVGIAGIRRKFTK
jgi:hypothetical protein